MRHPPRPWALLLAFVVLVLGAGATYLWTPVGGVVQDTVRSAVARREALVSPGPLSRQHAAVIEAGDCQACHDLAGSLPDDKCVACHRDVRDRMVSGIGWHGTFEGACSSCHRDHRGPDIVGLDRDTFNHRLARFPLLGRHQELGCEECHLVTSPDAPDRLQFQGRPFATCRACHDDPHTPSLGGDCARCHDERGFTGRLLHFVHDRDAAFPLDGRHAQVACESCHEPPATDPRLGAAPLRGTPSGCAACHEDRHTPSLGDACATCHDESGWTGRSLRFRHDVDTTFHLTGAHADVACVACHRPAPGAPLGGATLRGTPRDCAACHSDPHTPTLGSDCARCHGGEQFTGRALRFRHDEDTAFPLTGAHRSVACAECHRAQGDDRRLAAATLRGTSSSCADCHTSPHSPAFAQDCSACHVTSSFEGRAVTVDHAAFPLRGGHADVSCAQCHTPRVPATGGPARLSGAEFVGRSIDCAACHTDPHEGSLAPKSCATCHDVTGWDRPRFDHGRDAAFALDATHRRLDCAACHEGRVFRPLATDCATCHADVADALFGRPRGVAPSTPPAAADPHAGRVACTACHDTSQPAEDVEGDAAAMASRCTQCHAPAYAQLHLDRTRRVAQHVLDLRRRHAGDEARLATVEALRRWSFHDYVAAEKRLAELSR